MTVLDCIILFAGAAIVLWYLWWFGTERGENLLSTFTDERFKLFVIFNTSLIIAFALIGIYTIRRMGAL